ncbi:hypothetical protein N9X05_16115 [Paracoccaceae bacterium]|nr:hypothetical protein [Paracoccaceae bacterium]
MKYLVLALTLIFSMSGSVNAENENTRWILIMTQTGLVDTPDGIHTSVFQSVGDYQKGTPTASECYEGLKQDALYKNKTSGTFQGESRFKIEIINDVIISAKARYANVRFELHCVQITLD